MELWIRSQDKTILTKVDNICIMENRIVFIPNRTNGRTTLGTFKTDKRALEILDEISKTIKNQYIVKSKCLIKPSDMMKEKEYLENTYDGDFIMQPLEYEIEPINPNIIYYEMPKE